MKLKSEEIYHVYNRGNNKQRIFYEAENYPFFISRLKAYISPHCDLLAYCLMPNHFHLLIRANKKTNIPYRRLKAWISRTKPDFPRITRFSKGLQVLLSSYAKAINKRNSRTGSLFAQNTKAKRTSDELYSNDYSVMCFIYIHNNPVTAGLVKSPEEWEYSSYRDYAGLNTSPSICNIELGKKLLSLEENDIFHMRYVEVPQEYIKKIFR